MTTLVLRKSTRHVDTPQPPAAPPRPMGPLPTYKEALSLIGGLSRPYKMPWCPG